MTLKVILGHNKVYALSCLKIIVFPSWKYFYIIFIVVESIHNWVIGVYFSDELRLQP